MQSFVYSKIYISGSQTFQTGTHFLKQHLFWDPPALFSPSFQSISSFLFLFLFTNLLNYSWHSCYYQPRNWMFFPSPGHQIQQEGCDASLEIWTISFESLNSPWYKTLKGGCFLWVVLKVSNLWNSGSTQKSPSSLWVVLFCLWFYGHGVNKFEKQRDSLTCQMTKVDQIHRSVKFKLFLPLPTF